MKSRLLLVAALLLGLAPQSAFAQSLREMAGQMILVGFQGDAAGDPWPEALAGMIARSEIGGVMYLRVNVASLDAVREMNRLFIEAAPSPRLPPLIALDQEGGDIERLTSAVGFEEIPGARRVAESLSPAEAEALYENMARRVVALGFNLNFGPVVDLDTNPDNPIIARYGRAFSADPETVTSYASAFIRAHRRAGLMTALKHFPGHGSSTADSHEGFVDISDTWRESELSPYAALIEAGEADMVMTGHLILRALGASDVPASLSGAVIEGILRDEIGFQGVVISDDMEMGAIRQNFGRDQAILRAVRAGTDILLFSNTAEPSLDLPGEVLEVLLAEAARDDAFRRRIEESYARIAALKAQITIP